MYIDPSGFRLGGVLGSYAGTQDEDTRMEFYYERVAKYRFALKNADIYPKMNLSEEKLFIRNPMKYTLKALLYIEDTSFGKWELNRIWNRINEDEYKGIYTLYFYTKDPLRQNFEKTYRFDPITKTIYWVPNAAPVLPEDNRYGSSARALSHEIGHVIDWLNGDAYTENSREKEIIENYENKIAEEWNEPRRKYDEYADGYMAQYVYVNDPTVWGYIY